MNTNLIALPKENPDLVCDYLKQEGFNPTVWGGFDNGWIQRDPETLKWALSTEHKYERDHPGSGYKISGTVIGCTMSHWTLWKALDYLGQEDWYHVMEADIKFRDGWRARFDKAMEDVPSDWDMIYTGSCCADQTNNVQGEVYKGSALCTHWYMVRHKALATLIETNQKAEAPIDIQICLESHPKLNVYTILPRLADQHNTVIPD